MGCWVPELGGQYRRDRAGAGLRPAGRDAPLRGFEPVRRANPRSRCGVDRSGHQSGGGPDGSGSGCRRHRCARDGERRTRGPARQGHLAVRVGGGGPGGTGAGAGGRGDRRWPRRGRCPGAGGPPARSSVPVSRPRPSPWSIPATAEAIVRGQDAERSSVLDIARGARWSTSKYTARTLGHPYLDRWRGREAKLAEDPQVRHAYRANVPPLPVWAGEGVDLVNDLPPAADLVVALAAQAESGLARAGRY